MIETDSPLIREALVARLGDENYEVRGEALVGLAQRGDERVYEALIPELACEEVCVLHLEAAEILKDNRLLPLLREIEKSLADGDDEYFINRLRDAISACS